MADNENIMGNYISKSPEPSISLADFDAGTEKNDVVPVISNENVDSVVESTRIRTVPVSFNAEAPTEPDGSVGAGTELEEEPDIKSDSEPEKEPEKEPDGDPDKEPEEASDDEFEDNSEDDTEDEPAEKPEYKSVSEFGYHILEELWAGTLDISSLQNCINRENGLWGYIKTMEGADDVLKEFIDKWCAEFRERGRAKRKEAFLCYRLAYALYGKAIMNYKESYFTNVKELSDYMTALYTASYNDFKRFCYAITEGKDVLEAQTEAWLLALGKETQVKQWAEMMSAS